MTTGIVVAALLLCALRSPAQSNVPPRDVTTAVRASIACGLARLRKQCRQGYDGLPVFPANITRVSGGAGTTPRWGEGFVGNNAIVLLAMRKAGIPATDPEAAGLARRLGDLVNTYGIPDTTWDVAWLGAALSHMPGDELAELRERVLGKLLDGQVDSGEARGMWGPVCVNPRILAEIDGYETALEARMKAATDSGRQPDAKLLANRELLQTFKRVSARQGDRYAEVTQNCDIKPDGAPPITVQGLPYSFYSQTFADLETTAYAIFALREAKRNGVLPERSWRPRGKTARLTIASVKASFVLEQAVAALARAQKTDGSWNEHNVHQVRNEFDDRDCGRLPPELLLKLSSRGSPTTTAQGFTAIRDAITAADAKGRLTVDSYRTELERGSIAVRRRLDDLLRATAIPSAEEKSVAPWNTFFSLRDIQRALDGMELVDIDLWQRLARHVISHQNDDGSWGPGRPPRQGQTVAPHPQASTALLAWRRQFTAKRAGLSGSQQRKLDYAAIDAVRAQAWLGSDYGGLRSVATAFALMFLCEGVRPPVAGYLKPAELKRPPPTLARAVDYLSDETGTPYLFQQLAIPPRKTDLDRLPVVVMPGTSPLDDAETRQFLKEYVAAGNLLLVELYNSMDISRERRKVAELVKNGRVGTLSTKAPLLADFEGAKPTLRTAQARDTERFAVFLQLQASAGESKHGAIPFSKAAQTAYLAIKQSMEPSMLKESYLHEIPGASDPFAARKTALNKLTTK